jgi:heme exporter protein B
VSAPWLAQAWAVARKDLILEARSRERLMVTGTFAVLVVIVFAFALDPTVRVRSVAGAMIWVTVLFAGTLGLGRSFAVEREDDALAGLIVSPADRGALFAGKMAANLVLVLAMEAVVFPAYAFFFGLSFGPSLGTLAGIVALATVGFICLGTLFAAVAAHTRLGETLMPILLLPLLLPVVIFAASATQRLMVGRPPAEALSAVKMLLAFDLVYLVLCPVLFGAVLEE